MRMPFGRHQGKDLAELSDRYLAWLAGLDLYPPLSDAVRCERTLREGGEPELVSFPKSYIPRFQRSQGGDG